MPIDSDAGICELLNGFVKTCLSNIAPRTGQVRVDIDVDHLREELDYNLDHKMDLYNNINTADLSLFYLGGAESGE